MASFFKNFGKGVLYVLVLPALLAGLAIYAVVALFVFIYLAIKGLILFFTGRSLYEDLPEDVEAKRILNRSKGIIEDEVKEKKEEEPLVQEVNDEVEEEPNDSDPFYVPEYLKQHQEETQEPLVEESKEEPQPVAPEEPKEDNSVDPYEALRQPVDSQSIEIQKDEEKAEEAPIFPSKSSQNSNILHINEIDDMDDSDEENSGSGINIDFD